MRCVELFFCVRQTEQVKKRQRYSKKVVNATRGRDGEHIADASLTLTLPFKLNV